MANKGFSSLRVQVEAIKEVVELGHAIKELDRSHDPYYYPYHCRTGHPLRDCSALKEQHEYHSQITATTLYESCPTKHFLVVVGTIFRRI